MSNWHQWPFAALFFASIAHCAYAGQTPASDAETRLATIYASMAANDLARADAQAEELVAKHPKFRLGHAVRGDLLMLHAGQMPKFGSRAAPPTATHTDLLAEGAARLRSTLHKPGAHKYPLALLQMRADSKYAVLVDTRRSRLYVYQNDDGIPRYVTDFYMSQGKRGVNKQTQGDQKTPLGVYTLGDRVADNKLSDFYGPGAITISYPNEWDRINRRTGSGIWVHGIPAAKFSDAPLSSDGCVVLNNQDLQALFTSVELGKTPIIISADIRFVDRTVWQAERDLAQNLLNAWRIAADGDNAEALRARYSPYFKAENGNTAVEWTRKFGAYSGDVRDVTSYVYPAREAMLMISFTVDMVPPGAAKPVPVQKRQYWAQDNGAWKIISESNL